MTARPTIDGSTVLGWFEGKLSGLEVEQACDAFAAELNICIQDFAGRPLRRKVRRGPVHKNQEAILLIQAAIAEKLHKISEINKLYPNNFSNETDLKDGLSNIADLLAKWGFAIIPPDHRALPSDTQNLCIWLAGNLMRIWNIGKSRETVTIGKETPLERALCEAFVLVTGKKVTTFTIQNELEKATWRHYILDKLALQNLGGREPA